MISIHALLAESDRNSQNIKRRHNISIHALLAESDVIREPATRGHNKFLSTLSLRRATAVSAALQLIPLISIHALLAESDARQ